MIFANRLFTLSFAISLWLVVTGKPYWGALIVFGALSALSGLMCWYFSDVEFARGKALLVLGESMRRKE